MTTIALDSRMIAVDSRSSRGNELRGNVVKLKLVHGRLYALSGALAVFDALIAWHHAGADPKEAPHQRSETCPWALIVIEPGKTPLNYRADCPYSEEIDLPWTCGSGCEYAQALLDHGFSPIEAVSGAARRDLQSGGPIVAYDLETMLPVDTTVRLREAAE